jgi:hypothetical protein
MMASSGRWAVDQMGVFGSSKRFYPNEHVSNCLFGLNLAGSFAGR